MDTSDHGGTEGVLDDNVVRLPRDWLGPREDLIPFGSASEPGPSVGLAPTADDFWGESSAAVQDAVQAPAVDAERRRTLPTIGRRTALLVGLAGVAAIVVLAAVFTTGGARPTPRPSPSLSASRVSPHVFVGAAAHREVASSARALRLAPAHRERPKPVRHKSSSPQHAVATPAVAEPASSSGSPVTSSPPTASPVTTASPESPVTTASPEASSPPSNAAASTVASSSASNSSSGSAQSSGNQPALGADGALAPGSSPDG